VSEEPACPTAPAGAQAPHAQRYWLLLTTVALGNVLAPLNSTMLAVALPEIRDDFHLSHAEIGWLVSAYLIAMAVAQPIGGDLSDRLGRRRVLRFGLIGFLVLSLAAAAAPNFWLLIAFRTAQAIVGAVVIPTGMAMVRESVPVRQLGQANGITGSLLSLAAATGPLLGAAFLALGSWRFIFFANLPIIALALFAQWRLNYPATPGTQPLRSARGLLDWPGALLFSATLISLTTLLNSLRGDDLVGLALGVAGTIGFVLLFFWRQRRTDKPLAGWRLFRLTSYRAATVNVMLMNLVMYTTLLTIPFFIRELQEKGNGTTGLLLGSMSILMAFLAPASGWLSDTHGRRLPAVAGAVIAFGATLIIVFGLRTDVSTAFLAGALALVGMGVGLTFGPSATAAIESAPREQAGIAAGTNSMMRYLGSIVGAGLLAGILSTDGAVPGIGVFRAVFIIVAVIAALAVVAAFWIHRFPPEEAIDVEPRAVPPLSERNVGGLTPSARRIGRSAT